MHSIEHGPLHACAAAPDGDAGQGFQQRPADSRAAVFGRHEEILDVERGTGCERRIGEEIQGESYRTPFAIPSFGNQGLEVAPAAKPMEQQALRADVALPRQALVFRQAPNEAGDRGDVPARPSTYADRFRLGLELFLHNAESISRDGNGRRCLAVGHDCASIA